MGNIPEQRVRRMAERQGLKLVKSRRRDPKALDYNKYVLVDARDGHVVYGRACPEFSFNPGDLNTATLGDCEQYLNEERRLADYSQCEFRYLIMSTPEVMERWDMPASAALRILGYLPLGDLECMVDGHGNLYWDADKVQTAEIEYWEFIAAKDWDGFVRHSVEHDYRLQRIDRRTGEYECDPEPGEDVNRPPVIHLP